MFPFVSTLNAPGSNIIHNWSHLCYFNCHHLTLSRISSFSIPFLPIIFNMLPLVTRTELFLGNPPGMPGPTNLLLTNGIWQKWWTVTPEYIKKDCDFHLACILSLFDFSYWHTLVSKLLCWRRLIARNWSWFLDSSLTKSPWKAESYSSTTHEELNPDNNHMSELGSRSPPSQATSWCHPCLWLWLESCQTPWARVLG